MISFPFDSVVTYDEDGQPIYDRGADSDTLARYFHLLFTDGVFPNPSSGLQVGVAEQEMSVVVSPGNVNIQGRLGIEDNVRTLVFEAAGMSYDRIDSVVARLNKNQNYRKVDLYVLKGEEESVPMTPELTRTGGVHELRLANVFIAKNTSMIAAERITDTRLNTTDCGIVTANPDTVDTTSIYNQYQASLDKYMQYVENCIEGTTVGRFENLIGSLFQNLSDAFDVEKSYAVGEYCIYENELYRCKTAVTNTGAWNADKWEVTTVGKELTVLNSNLSHVGMIVQSTKLDTEEKVKAIYGANTIWTKIEGRFLLGTSSSYTINSIGGEEKHALTVAETGAHSHTFMGSNVASGTQSANHVHGIPALSGTTTNAGVHTHGYPTAGNMQNYATGEEQAPLGYISNGSSGATFNDGNHNHSVITTASTSSGNNVSHYHTVKAAGTISSSGSGTAHNNMPPYKVVYIWERTA